MKYKKSTITAIVLAILLVAGATTAFATSALTANTENGGMGSNFIDENGNKHSVTDGQVNQAGKFSLGDDGTLTPAQSDDSLLDSCNINPFSSENNDELTGNNTTHNFEKNENANAFDFSELRSKVAQEQDNITPKTYTKDEWVRIIADIESGRIKPYTPNDGENGIFYDGENYTPVNW